MTQITDVVEAEETYAVSCVHCGDREAPPLVIARPIDSHSPPSTPSSDVTLSSIHLREHQPCLLYRCAGSRLILTCLDTAALSTVLEFGSAIRAVGVHDDSSNLVIHVFMESGLLYSMILTPEYLENPRAKKEEGWISEYLAPSFQIRDPLYMYSLSATDIIFTLQDGGLLRLSNNGGGYNEHIFSDSSYFSSFKSILPWSGRPSNLIVSAKSWLAKNVLFTMSVDAKIKVWDIRKGQLLGLQDAFRHSEPLTFLLDPTPSRFLAIHEHASSLTLVTYCPQHRGVFKIFRFRGNGLEELFQFREQQPATGLWRVFEFVVSDVRSDGSIVLHVLWKLDTLSLLQTAHVHLPHQKVTWSFAVPDGSIREIPTVSSGLIAEFVFTPDRFSTQTIGKALAALSTTDALETSTGSLPKLRTIADTYIKNSIKLEIDPETGHSLSDKFEEDVRLRYLNFAQICIEIDRLASEPHALCYAAHTRELMVAQSGKFTVLQRASPLQRLLNYPLDTPSVDDPMLGVLHTAKLLSQGLSSDSWYLIGQVFRDESVADRTLSADDAMYIAYEKTIENQLPEATILALRQGNLSTKTIQDGLHALLPSLSPKSLRGSIRGVLGIDSYVAGYRSSIGCGLQTIVVLLAFLLHSSCSDENVDIHRSSILYIEYLQAYRQLSLINDSLSKSLAIDDTPNDVDMDVSRVTVSDEDDIPSKVAGGVVFYGLAIAYDGDIPIRDFLERTLIFLVNKSQSALAVYFSQYIAHAPLSSYLKARSLLLDGQFEEASSLFARTAYPLVNSSATKCENELEIKLRRSDLSDYYLHVAALFHSARRHSESLRFCTEASVAARATTIERRQEIRQRVFSAAIDASDWSQAYRALSSENRSLRSENIRKFVVSICESSNAHLLATLPFVGMLGEVDSALEKKARGMLDVRATPSYHKILFAHRIEHSDFRGAATILYHKLQFLRNKTHINGYNAADHLEITEAYLAVINTMRCLPTADAWIIIGSMEYVPAAKRTKTSGEDDRVVKRKVLKLEDVKKEYAAELRNLQAQLDELAGLTR